MCVVAITIITIVGRADAKTGGEKGGRPFNHRPKPVDCILFVVGGGYVIFSKISKKHGEINEFR